MNKSALKVLLKELIWLFAILGISALIEFLIIETFDLHPVLSIKLQGLIGLVIIGYAIRMGARLWRSFHSSDDADQEEKDALDEF
ncbi:hypothetical protein [Gracilimonas tropica]|uniref:hypothetical protein n=1 Tax=Gracilimonas tropica TaxID=454600 RepID=UPI00036475B2|nr:hypothetical protein [Gracilimonas tropica]